MTDPEFDPDEFLASLNAELQAETAETAEHDREFAFMRQCAADLERRLIDNGVDTAALREKMNRRDTNPTVQEYGDWLDFELYAIADQLDPTVADKAFASGLSADFIEFHQIDPDYAEELKTDHAFRLLSHYGEQVSLPLRILMDDLRPEGTRVGELTGIDLERTPSGQEYLSDRANTSINSAISERMRLRAARALMELFGDRDDTAQQARTVALYALHRVKGRRPDIFMDDQVRQLLARYPGRQDFLEGLIIGISDSIAQEHPEIAKPSDEWSGVFEHLDESD